MSMQIQFIIFWIIIMVILFLGTMHNRFPRRGQLFLVFAAFFLLSYLYAYRTLGLDLRNYVLYYHSVNIKQIFRSFSIMGVFSWEYEPLFMMTIIIAKSLGLSVNGWLFIIVLFPSLVFYFTLFKKSKNPLLLFCFFVLIMMFQVDLSRFYLAAPFVCIAFRSKSSIKKIVFYCIAFGFHYSVMILLIIELINRLKISRTKKIQVLGILILGAFIFKQIDLSSLEYSEYRFLFKFWYNFVYSSTTTVMNSSQRIMNVVINIYPTFMCVFLLRTIKRDCINQYQNQESNLGSIDIRYIDTLRVGIIINIILIVLFGSIKIAFRTLLLTYFLLFIPIAELSKHSIYNGKIIGNAISYTILLFVYNILMAVYYVFISIIY